MDALSFFPPFLGFDKDTNHPLFLFFASFSDLAHVCDRIGCVWAPAAHPGPWWDWIGIHTYDNKCPHHDVRQEMIALPRPHFLFTSLHFFVFPSFFFLQWAGKVPFSCLLLYYFFCCFPLQNHRLVKSTNLYITTDTSFCRLLKDDDLLLNPCHWNCNDDDIPCRRQGLFVLVLNWKIRVFTWAKKSPLGARCWPPFSQSSALLTE